MLTTGMPGTEHRIPERWAFRSSAPLPLISQQQVQCFRTRRLLPLERDRPLVTAFPSPATAAACAASIPRSTVLACYFAGRSLLPWPGPPSAPHPLPVCTRSRPLLRLRPVANSTTSVAGCALRFHSPSGILLPSGSKRSADLAACRPAFRFARSPFAPRCSFYY